MMRAIVLAKFSENGAKEAYLKLKDSYQVLPLFGNYDMMIAVEEKSYDAASRTILKINRMDGIGDTQSLMVIPHEVLVDVFAEKEG